jgi:hypothetical protein
MQCILVRNEASLTRQKRRIGYSYCAHLAVGPEFEGVIATLQRSDFDVSVDIIKSKLREHAERLDLDTESTAVEAAHIEIRRIAVIVNAIEERERGRLFSVGYDLVIIF